MFYLIENQYLFLLFHGFFTYGSFKNYTAQNFGSLIYCNPPHTHSYVCIWGDCIMLILKVLRYVIFEWALSSNVVSCFTALIVIIPDIPATIRWIFISFMLRYFTATKFKYINPNTLTQLVTFCRRIVWVCLTILWGRCLKG